MEKINWDKLSVKDIGALISGHLHQNGFKPILSGGACVSIYSKNKYQSGDLDFVMSLYCDIKKLDKVMGELGFERTKDHRHYIHPECPYYVEFPPSPLSVGEEIIERTDEYKNEYGTLKLLSPTDCVKDRLAAYYHWKDQASLEQAILVALEEKIDMKDIERWSREEGCLEKFKEFQRQLKRRKKMQKTASNSLRK